MPEIRESHPRVVRSATMMARLKTFAKNWQRPAVRRFHAYCIGTPKSGTHSIARMFDKRHRAAHEPIYEPVIRMILAAASGSVSDDQLVEFIRSRDRSLQLEMESSHLLIYFLDLLLAEFAEAKFILTIRDCYSWLDSQINNQLAYIEAGHWKDFGEFKYESETRRHPKEEQVLARFGVYTLDGYLSAWASHNQQALAIVPADKLLVVRTGEISRDLKTIAAFVGVPANQLSALGAHSFKTEKKYGLMAQLDEQYLDDRVNAHCRTLMDAHFPKLKDFKAWKLSQNRS